MSPGVRGRLEFRDGLRAWVGGILSPSELASFLDRVEDLAFGDLCYDFDPANEDDLCALDKWTLETFFAAVGDDFEGQPLVDEALRRFSDARAMIAAGDRNTRAVMRS